MKEKHELCVPSNTASVTTLEIDISSLKNGGCTTLKLPRRLHTISAIT